MILKNVSLKIYRYSVATLGSFRKSRNVNCYFPNPVTQRGKNSE